jgi:hypothetical protein
MGLTLRPEAFRAWVALCVEGLAAARAGIGVELDMDGVRAHAVAGYGVFE